MQEAPYNIYNASAGSGKTYTLAKEYLKIILSSDFNKSYRNILAITFTNKAVNEMKQRILGSLFAFGKISANSDTPPMLLDISKELGVEIHILQKRAKQTLKEILHNYAFFDVSTIDKFTHRLIRTFAKDLKLPQNFEVVLDTDLLLDEAIAKLLNKAGSDAALTKVLIDFALEKIDEDKSWDIAIDLHNVGKLLFNENHHPHLKKFEEKKLDDFLVLKSTLIQNVKILEAEIKEDAQNVLDIIEENGLEFNNFKSSYFPKFIHKIASGDLKIDFKAGWKQKFDSDPLYTKSCPQGIKDILDGLHSQFNHYFQRIKENNTALSLMRNAYNNLVPLTVLNAIQQEIKSLETERDLLPISSFNSLISNEIKDQPAPFIYERIGEKYRHYFIDEFQDTSQMQWNNLTPLIGNALESEDDLGKIGSVMLVGDAKQAIYRWRGGRAEQFLNLINTKENPFVFPPTTTNLPANYRSHEEVIKFNNNFFTVTSPFLENSTYNELFIKGNQQAYNSKKGGMVQLSFIDPDADVDEGELYCKTVLNTLEQVLEKNYSLKDICILTRKKKEGILLADFLMQHNIPIISSETLLLNSNPKVRFLIDLLRYSLQPTDLEVSFNIISFLFSGKENLHQYIHAHLQEVATLLAEQYGFNIETLKQSSVYDGLENAIRKFDLAETSDAYITYLLDVVQEVEQKEGANSQVFLAHWEKKKSSLSITAPENVDAVQIMTIHKSKGLEFPIVIYPFANTNIYEEINPKLWIPVPEESFNGFTELLINKNQEVITYGEMAESIYNEEQHKLELDAFNLLYVALTRAEKALYIISKKDLTQKGEHKTKYYSGLFIHYLIEKGLWQESQLQYQFGALEIANSTLNQNDTQENIPYLYSHKDRPEFRILTKSGALWDTERETAISKGNLVHLILGQIKTKEDIENAIKSAVKNGDLPQVDYNEVRENISAIVEHSKLSEYYSPDVVIMNEQDILTVDGKILRPDRIVINNNEATIIDYKTGKKNNAYHQQLYAYSEALEKMGYKIKDKIIVYINDDIILDFII
ncbi:UvrD-helicase domain-containing protein [Arenibacter latericius]|uniref:UvrD-helicase domain-containing protein n=1 Tax=Arenibacter latericius TaxID=86104 RepID=UPI0004058D46|nr:UvrD-helicase domain-containing protein [Arenibacter latericius]MDX1364513.1 UvrD-helicase domain-containing protein [Arenibacter latericius]